MKNYKSVIEEVRIIIIYKFKTFQPSSIAPYHIMYYYSFFLNYSTTEKGKNATICFLVQQKRIYLREINT